MTTEDKPKVPRSYRVMQVVAWAMMVAIWITIAIILISLLMHYVLAPDLEWLDRWQAQHDQMMDNLPTLAPSKAP